MSKNNNSNPSVETVLQGDDQNQADGSNDFFGSLEAQVNMCCP